MMKINNTLPTKVGSNETAKAAGPRRPLRKPPRRSRPASPPPKPVGNKPAQSPRSTKPTGK